MFLSDYSAQSSRFTLIRVFPAPLCTESCSPGGTGRPATSFRRWRGQHERAVISEIARVLRPGGLLLFDTINRTALAQFVIVALGEKVLRLLPRGTHDFRQFIRPDKLRTLLEGAGLDMPPVVGL